MGIHTQENKSMFYFGALEETRVRSQEGVGTRPDKV